MKSVAWRVVSAGVLLWLLASQAAGRIILTGLEQTEVDIENGPGSNGTRTSAIYTVSIRCTVGDRAILGEVVDQTNATGVLPGTLLDIEVSCDDFATRYELRNVTRVPLGSGVVSVTSGVDAQLGYHLSLEKLVRAKAERGALEQRALRKRNLEQYVARRDAGRKRVWGAIVGTAVATVVFGNLVGKSNVDCKNFNKLLSSARITALESCVMALSKSIDEVNSGFTETLEAYSINISNTIIALTDSLQEQIYSVSNFTEEVNEGLQASISASQAQLGLINANAAAIGNLATEQARAQEITDSNFREVEKQFEQASNERDQIVESFNAELQNLNDNLLNLAGAVGNEFKLVYERMYISFSQVNDQLSKLDIDTSLRLSQLAAQTEDAINDLYDTQGETTAELSRVYGLITRLYDAVKELTQLQYSAADLIIAYWDAIDKLQAQQEDITIFLDELGDRPMNLRDWNFIGAREFRGRVWNYENDARCNTTNPETNLSRIDSIHSDMDAHYRTVKTTWEAPVDNLRMYHRYTSDRVRVETIRADDGTAVRLGACYSAAVAFPNNVTSNFTASYTDPTTPATPYVYPCHRRVNGTELVSEASNTSYPGLSFCEPGECGTQAGMPAADWQHAAYSEIELAIEPAIPSVIQTLVISQSVVRLRVLSIGDVDLSLRYVYLYDTVDGLAFREFVLPTEARDDEATSMKLDFQRSPYERITWRGEAEFSNRLPYIRDDTCVVVKPFTASSTLKDGYAATSPLRNELPATQPPPPPFFPAYRFTTNPALPTSSLSDCLHLVRAPGTGSRRRAVEEEAPPPLELERGRRATTGRELTALVSGVKTMQCQEIWDRRLRKKTDGKLYVYTNTAAPAYKASAPHSIDELESLDFALENMADPRCLSTPGCMLASVVLPRHAWVINDGQPTEETLEVPVGRTVEYVRPNRASPTIGFILPSGMQVEVCSSNPATTSTQLVNCDTFRGPTFDEPKTTVASGIEVFSDTLTYRVTLPTPQNTRVVFSWFADEDTYYKATCVSSTDYGATATYSSILADSSSLPERDAFQATCTNQDINTYNGIFLTALEHWTKIAPFGITMSTTSHTTTWSGISVISTTETAPAPGLYVTGANTAQVTAYTAPNVNIAYRAPLRRCWDECRTVDGNDAYQKDVCETILGDRCIWRTTADLRNGVCVARDSMNQCEVPPTVMGPTDEAFECMVRGQADANNPPDDNFGCMWDGTRPYGERCRYHSVIPPPPVRARVSCSARIDSPAEAFSCGSRDGLQMDQAVELLGGRTIKTDLCFYQFDRANQALHRDQNWCLPLRDSTEYSLVVPWAGSDQRGYHCMNAGVDCEFGLVNTREQFYTYMEPPGPSIPGPADFSETFNSRNWKGVRGCGAYNQYVYECETKSRADSVVRLTSGLGRTSSYCESTSTTCSKRCAFHRTARACVDGTYAGKCTWVYDGADHWPGADIMVEANTTAGYHAMFPGTVAVTGGSATVVVHSKNGSYPLTLPGEIPGNVVVVASDVTQSDPEVPVRLVYKAASDLGKCTENRFLTTSSFNTCGENGRRCANIQSYCNLYNNKGTGSVTKFNHTPTEPYSATDNSTDLTQCQRDPKCAWVIEDLPGNANTTNTKFCAAYGWAKSQKCDPPLQSSSDTCMITQLTGLGSAMDQLGGQCIIVKEGARWEDCLGVMAERGDFTDVEKATMCSMELCVEKREESYITGDDALGGRCVFVEVGDTGSTHCYAPGDPSVRLLEEQYAGLVTITLYDDYIARDRFVRLEGVSLNDLAEGDFLVDATDVTAVEIGDVYGTTGLRGVPDSIEALFPCPDKYDEDNERWLTYRPIGRQCCETQSIGNLNQGTLRWEVCDPDPGTGLVAYPNPNHPRVLYHKIAMDMCEDPADPGASKEDQYLVPREMLVYYFCRFGGYDNPADPNTQERNPEDCGFGPAAPNTTGFEPVSGMYCFPFLREEDCRDNVCERLPSPTACLISADVGSTGVFEDFVRVDASVIEALQDAEHYVMYDGKAYAITEWHEIQSNRVGGAVDIVVNGSSLNPLSIFGSVFQRDIEVIATTLIAFFGNKPAAWGGTLGDVESITRNNVKTRRPDGSSQRLLQQYEAKFAWRTRTTVPVYRYRNRKRACSGSWRAMPHEGGPNVSFVPVRSTSCVGVGDHEAALPDENDLLIHHTDPFYNIVVSPPTHRIDINGPKGTIGAFHTYGAPDIERQDFLRRVPTYDPDIFQTSPWLYSNTIDPDDKWCGFMLRSGPDDTGYKLTVEADGTTNGLGIELLVNFRELERANAAVPANYAGTGAGMSLAAYWKTTLEDTTRLYGSECAVSEEARTDLDRCATAAVWLTRIANATALAWVEYSCTMPFTNFAFGPADPPTATEALDVLHLLWDGFLCYTGNLSAPTTPGTFYNEQLAALCGAGGGGDPDLWYFRPSVNTEGVASGDAPVLQAYVIETFIEPRKFAQCGNCEGNGTTGFCDVPGYIPPMESDLSARYGLCMLSQHYDIEWDGGPGEIVFNARSQTAEMDLVFQVRLDGPLQPPHHTGVTCPSGSGAGPSERPEVVCDPVFRRCTVRLHNPSPVRNLDFVRVVVTAEDCVLPRFAGTPVAGGNLTMWVRREVLAPGSIEEFTYELCPGQYDIRHIPVLLFSEEEAASNPCSHARFLVQLGRTREEESFVSLFGTGVVQVVGDITLSNFGRAFEDLTDEVVAARLTDVVYTRKEIELVIGQSVAGLDLTFADQFLRFIDSIELRHIVDTGIGDIVGEWNYDRTNETIIRGGSNPDFIEDVYDHVEDVAKEVDKLNETYDTITEGLKNASEENRLRLEELDEKYKNATEKLVKEFELLRDSLTNGAGDEDGTAVDVWLIVTLSIASLALVVGIVGVVLYANSKQNKEEDELKKVLESTQKKYTRFY